MAYSKYGNNVCYLSKGSLGKFINIPDSENPLDYYRFDSELERQVYLDLDDYIRTQNVSYSLTNKPFILTLHRQVKIDLLKQNLSGIEISHVVDFCLELRIPFAIIDSSIDNVQPYKLLQTWYIEAKGVPTEVAMIKWKLLEAKYRYFELGKYYAVGNSKKIRQAINGHWITSTKVALQSINKGINAFIDAYECINGVR